MLKMTENGCDVILINRLRACLALAIFASAINSVNKLYVNAIDTRRAPYDLLQLRNEDLDVRPKLVLRLVPNIRG